MVSNNNNMKKIISIITICAFMVNTLCIEAFSSSGNSTLLKKPVDHRTLQISNSIPSRVSEEFTFDTFFIPDSLGRIETLWSPAHTPEKTIIHIQDAHCNYAAQKSISGIINFLTGKYGRIDVNLEGGSGDYDLSIFRSIDDKEKISGISDSQMKRGIISGAEYYAINNPEKVRLWGVENTGFYIKNLNVYRWYLDNKEKINSLLLSLRYSLEEIKKELYSEDLMLFDRTYMLYKSQNIGIKKYLAYLADISEKNHVAVDDLKDLNLMIEALNKESSIDFETAGDHRDILIKDLSSMLSKDDRNELVEKMIAFTNKNIPEVEFYKYISDKASGINLNMKNAGDFVSLVDYMDTYTRSDKARCFNEINILEGRIKDTLCTEPGQKELVELSTHLSLIVSMFNFAVSRDDYNKIISEKESFGFSRYSAFFEKHGRGELHPGCESFDEWAERISLFYEYSMLRDRSFVENLFPSNTRDGVNKKISILVTGGFHTESLLELFKEKDIAFISVMPSFNNSEDYRCPYFDLLSGGIKAENGNIIQSLEISSIAVSSLLSRLGFIARGKEEYFGHLLGIHMNIARATEKNGLAVFNAGEVRYFDLNGKEIFPDETGFMPGEYHIVKLPVFDWEGLAENNTESLLKEYSLSYYDEWGILPGDMPVMLSDVAGIGTTSVAFTGKVHKAGETRPAVIKCLLPQDDGSGSVLKRTRNSTLSMFIREEAIMRELSEKGILDGYYGRVDLDGVPAFAMELIKGVSTNLGDPLELYNAVNERTVPSIKRIVRDILEKGYYPEDLQFLIMKENQKIGGKLYLKGEAVLLDVGDFSRKGLEERLKALIIGEGVEHGTALEKIIDETEKNYLTGLEYNLESAKKIHDFIKFYNTSSPDYSVSRVIYDPSTFEYVLFFFERDFLPRVISIFELQSMAFEYETLKGDRKTGRLHGRIPALSERFRNENITKVNSNINSPIVRSYASNVFSGREKIDALIASSVKERKYLSAVHGRETSSSGVEDIAGKIEDHHRKTRIDENIQIRKSFTELSKKVMASGLDAKEKNNIYKVVRDLFERSGRSNIVVYNTDTGIISEEDYVLSLILSDDRLAVCDVFFKMPREFQERMLLRSVLSLSCNKADGIRGMEYSIMGPQGDFIKSVRASVRDTAMAGLRDIMDTLLSIEGKNTEEKERKEFFRDKIISSGARGKAFLEDILKGVETPYEEKLEALAVLAKSGWEADLSVMTETLTVGIESLDDSITGSAGIIMARSGEKVIPFIKPLFEKYGPDRNLLWLVELAEAGSIIPYIKSLKPNDLDESIIRGKLLILFGDGGGIEEILDILGSSGNDLGVSTMVYSVIVNPAVLNKAGEILRRDISLEERLIDYIGKAESSPVKYELLTLLSMSGTRMAADFLWKEYDSSRDDGKKDRIIKAMANTGEYAIPFLTAQRKRSDTIYRALGEINSPSSAPFLLDEYEKLMRVREHVPSRKSAELIYGIIDGMPDEKVPYLLVALGKMSHSKESISNLLSGVSTAPGVIKMLESIAEEGTNINDLYIANSLVSIDERTGLLRDIIQAYPRLKEGAMNSLMDDIKTLKVSDDLYSGALELLGEFLSKDAVNNMVASDKRSTLKDEERILKILGRRHEPVSIAFLLDKLSSPVKKIRDKSLEALLTCAKTGHLGYYIEKSPDGGEYLISKLREYSARDMTALHVLAYSGAEQALNTLIEIFEETFDNGRDMYSLYAATVIESLLMANGRLKELLRSRAGIKDKIVVSELSLIRGSLGRDLRYEERMRVSSVLRRWSEYVCDITELPQKKRSAERKLFRIMPVDEYWEERGKITSITIKLKDYLNAYPDAEYMEVMNFIAKDFLDLEPKVKARVRSGIVNYCINRERIKTITSYAGEAGIESDVLYERDDIEADAGKKDFIKGVVGFIPEKIIIIIAAETLHIVLDPDSYGKVYFSFKESIFGAELDVYDSLTGKEKAGYMHTGGAYYSGELKSLKGVPLSGIITVEKMNGSGSDSSIADHEFQHKFFHLYANGEVESFNPGLSYGNSLIKHINRLLYLQERTGNDIHEQIDLYKRKLKDTILKQVILLYQDELMAKVYEGEWSISTDFDISKWVSFYEGSYRKILRDNLYGISDRDMLTGLLDEVFYDIRVRMRLYRELVYDMSISRMVLLKEGNADPFSVYTRANHEMAAFLQTVPATKFDRLDSYAWRVGGERINTFTADKNKSEGRSPSGAYSFLAGILNSYVWKTLVSPSTVFHETGHVIWALFSGQSPSGILKGIFNGEVKGIPENAKRFGGITGNIFGAFSGVVFFWIFSEFSYVPAAVFSLYAAVINAVSILSEIYAARAGVPSADLNYPDEPYSGKGYKAPEEKDIRFSPAVVHTEYMRIKTSEKAYYSKEPLRDMNGAEGIQPVTIRDRDDVYAYSKRLRNAGLASDDIKSILVDGREIEITVDKELAEAFSLTESKIAEMVKESLMRSNGDVSDLPPLIVLSLLDRSSNVFEDHTRNGFIGVNRILFDRRINEKIAEVLFRTGFQHEIAHEADVSGSVTFEREQIRRDAVYMVELLSVMPSPGDVLKAIIILFRFLFENSSEFKYFFKSVGEINKGTQSGIAASGTADSFLRIKEDTEYYNERPVREFKKGMWYGKRKKQSRSGIEEYVKALSEDWKVSHDIRKTVVAGREIKVVIDKELAEFFDLSERSLGELIARPLVPSGGDINNMPETIVIGIVDRGPDLFENSPGNGFIGVNRILVDNILDKKMSEIFFKTGIIHSASCMLASEKDDRFRRTQIKRDAVYMAKSVRSLASVSGADGVLEYLDTVFGRFFKGNADIDDLMKIVRVILRPSPGISLSLSDIGAEKWMHGVRGHMVTNIMEHRGAPEALDNGYELRRGRYRVKHAMTEFKQVHFIVPQREALKELNPLNDNPNLPVMAGFTGSENYWPNMRQPDKSNTLYGQGLVFEYIEGVPLKRNIPIPEAEEMDPWDRGYVNNKMKNTEYSDRPEILIDIAIKVLEGYRDTYSRGADEVYINGDIDPTGILISEDEEGNIERAVFVDNDSTSAVSDISESAEERKRLAKGEYCSEDRQKRMENDTTPVDKLCLPRDDLFAICETLLESFFGDGYLDEIMNVKEAPANHTINSLKKIITGYRRRAGHEYALEEMLEELQTLKSDLSPYLESIMAASYMKIADDSRYYGKIPVKDLHTGSGLEKIDIKDQDSAELFAERLKSGGLASDNITYVEIEGRRIDITIDKEIESAFTVTQDDLKGLINDAMSLTGKSIDALPGKLVITSLDASPYMFEDHTGNGFIGVNRALLDYKFYPGINRAIFLTGMFHELSHEFTGLLSDKKLITHERKQLRFDAKYMADIVERDSINIFEIYRFFDFIFKLKDKSEGISFSDALRTEVELSKYGMGMIPDMWRPYEVNDAAVDSVVGYGSTSIVFGGKVLAGGRAKEAAIKVLRPETPGSEGGRAEKESYSPEEVLRFYSQTDILRDLSALNNGEKPIVPSYYGITDIGGAPSFAVEKIKGVNINPEESDPEKIVKAFNFRTIPSIERILRIVHEKGYRPDDINFMLLTEDQTLGGAEFLKGEVILIDTERLVFDNSYDLKELSAGIISTVTDDIDLAESYVNFINDYNSLDTGREMETILQNSHDGDVLIVYRGAHQGVVLDGIVFDGIFHHYLDSRDQVSGIADRFPDLDAVISLMDSFPDDEKPSKRLSAVRLAKEREIIISRRQIAALDKITEISKKVPRTDDPTALSVTSNRGGVEYNYVLRNPFKQSIKVKDRFRTRKVVCDVSGRGFTGILKYEVKGETYITIIKEWTWQRTLDILSRERGRIMAEEAGNIKVQLVVPEHISTYSGGDQFSGERGDLGRLLSLDEADTGIYFTPEGEKNNIVVTNEGIVLTSILTGNIKNIILWRDGNHYDKDGTKKTIKVADPEQIKIKEASEREEVVISAFSGVNRPRDKVRIVVGVDKRMLKSGSESLSRNLSRALSKQGFGSLEDTRQIVLFSIDMMSREKTRENYENAMVKAKAGLTTGDRIVLFAPEMNSFISLASAAAEKYSGDKTFKGAVNVVPDSYNDNGYTDILSRFALAKHIAFYYSGNDKKTAIQAINSLLTRISMNGPISDIDDIFDILRPLKMKKIDYGSISQWIRSQKRIAVSA